MARGLVLALGLGLMAQSAAAAPALSDFVVFGSTSVTVGAGTGAPVHAPVGSNGSVVIGQNGSLGDGDDAIILTGGGAYSGAAGGNYVGDIIFSGTVSLGQNSVVTGSIHSGGAVSTNAGVKVSGDVIASENIVLGANNQIGGNVHAGGKVTTAQNTAIGGTASAGSTVSLGNNATAGAIVNGAAAPTPVAPPVITMPGAHAFTAGGDSHHVNANSSLSLLADSYGAVSLASSGSLGLSSGEYFFDSMMFGANGTLELDLGLGGIVINIVGDLSIGANFDIVLLDGNPADVLFEVHGDVNVGQNVDWFGTLFAPDSKIAFGAGANITGALYGDVVNIGQNSVFNHAASLSLFQAQGPEPAQVSEPAALGILGLGLIGIGLYRRRRA